MRYDSGLYEPLQYVLFFFHGTRGWYPGMMSISGELKLSQIEYYRHRMLAQVDEVGVHGRINRFDMLGRLCNEYLVDMYSRVEDERLSFIACNQSRLARCHDLEMAAPRPGAAAVDETVHGDSWPAAGRVYLTSSMSVASSR